jgi:hypothetical protein
MSCGIQGEKMMNRKTLPTVGLIIILIGSSNIAEAAPQVKAGAKCLKVGLIQTVNAKKFTCIKSGGKMVWDKGRLIVSTPTNPKTSNESAETSSQSEPNPFQAEVQKALDNKKKEVDSATDLIKAERSKFEELFKTKCDKNSPCQVGNKGPGGGVVVYVGQSRQAWGQYLDMAPSGWYSSVKIKLPGVQANGIGDPATYWCEKFEMDLTASVTSQELIGKLGIEIGKGFSNTQLMIAGCKSGAGKLANSYTGGGLNDWFLPSIAELNELCKFASGIKTGMGLRYLGGSSSNETTCGTREMPGSFTALGEFSRGENNKYWSSSENSNNRAWCQRFDDLWTSNWEKFNQFLVRPVRAF